MPTNVKLARMTARLPHFKGKFHITNYLSPRQGEVEGDIEGYRISLNLADLIQRHAFMHTFEVNEVRLMKRLLKPGEVFFDVGANIGYYTAIAARRVGSAGAIYAFEPEPSIFGKLSSWVSREGLSQVHCVNAALSSHPGVLSLYVPPRSFHNHNPSAVEYCAGMESISVRRITLDDYCAEAGIDRIGVLKLDVEGHEQDVLAGGRRMASAGKIGWMICEFNPEFGGLTGSSLDQLHRQIRATGFREQVYPGGPPLYPESDRELPNRLFRWME